MFAHEIPSRILVTFAMKVQAVDAKLADAKVVRFASRMRIIRTNHPWQKHINFQESIFNAMEKQFVLQF